MYLNTMEFQTGYYRILKNHENDYYREMGFKEGEMVHIFIGREKIVFALKDHTWTYKFDNQAHNNEFIETFEFVPNGAEFRQKEIADLIADIDRTDAQFAQNQLSLTNLNPHVASNGEFSTGTSLVEAGLWKEGVSDNYHRNQFLPKSLVWDYVIEERMEEGDGD